MVRVAALQMCSSASVENNLRSADELITAAAKDGAKLIVLPEMFPIMAHNEADKLANRESFGDGPIQTLLTQKARELKVWLVSGTIPIACKKNDKIRAACLLYNDEGIVVSRYDKIHLFDVQVTDSTYQESASTERGSHVTTVDTPFGKMGLAVCYDIRFPELFRQQFNKGTQIFVVPSAFTAATGAAHWEVLLRARAIENQCFVIAANQAGKHENGRETFGHSMIINPWGTIIAKQEAGVGIVTAEIDLAYLQEIRGNMPITEHQQLFTTTP